MTSMAACIFSGAGEQFPHGLEVALRRFGEGDRHGDHAGGDELGILEPVVVAAVVLLADDQGRGHVAHAVEGGGGEAFDQVEGVERLGRFADQPVGVEDGDLVTHSAAVGVRRPVEFAGEVEDDGRLVIRFQEGDDQPRTLAPAGRRDAQGVNRGVEVDGKRRPAAAGPQEGGAGLVGREVAVEQVADAGRGTAIGGDRADAEAAAADQVLAPQVPLPRPDGGSVGGEDRLPFLGGQHDREQEEGGPRVEVDRERGRPREQQDGQDEQELDEGVHGDPQFAEGSGRNRAGSRRRS